jgi:pimeloyl-ACP methyl ester carboxylesterase
MSADVTASGIHYEVQGSGAPVLFLHAFPLHLRMWDAQVEALPAGQQAIRFDARGFGQTPAGDSLLTMERIADDAAAVLDHLGAPPAVVCGLSMGGYAAFAMVRRHPEKIRALVLADTRSGPDTPESRQSRAEQRERVRREGSAVLADVFLRRLVGETTHRERAQVVSRLRQMILSASAQGITDALAGLAARADSTTTLREIRVPTLILCGTEDVLTPPAESEHMKAGIKGSELTLIPGAGHLSSLEDPDAFNAALGSFLARL